ncbi:NUDIX domain-containing protein [bacterium]|nr:MAG: NUDIX domain-containing protein [bacterium]
MKPHLKIALALIWREGEVLLSKRPPDADHLPDVWEFPGGKVEEGESAAEAAVREAREEIGLAVEVVTAREPIEWEYEKRFVTLYPFDCRIVSGEAAALQVAEVKFEKPSRIRKEDFPAANAILIEKLQGEAQPHI